MNQTHFILGFSHQLWIYIYRGKVLLSGHFTLGFEGGGPGPGKMLWEEELPNITTKVNN
jgi:hypothetical protein